MHTVPQSTASFASPRVQKPPEFQGSKCLRWPGAHLDLMAPAQAVALRRSPGAGCCCRRDHAALGTYIVFVLGRSLLGASFCLRSSSLPSPKAPVSSCNVRGQPQLLYTGVCIVTQRWVVIALIAASVKAKQQTQNSSRHGLEAMPRLHLPL